MQGSGTPSHRQLSTALLPAASQAAQTRPPAGICVGAATDPGQECSVFTVAAGVACAHGYSTAHILPACCALSGRVLEPGSIPILQAQEGKQGWYDRDKQKLLQIKLWRPQALVPILRHQVLMVSKETLGKK